jgi:diguanylate cyclase (GGDEF)-like protein
MLGNERKTIGVFVTLAYQEYQDILGRGIAKRAKELGYNVAFFSNFVGYGELKYEQGELSIVNLPGYDKLDGIILLPDTMFLNGFKEAVIEKIKKHSHCPVVSVRQEMEDFYNVLIDDETVLDEIITHFIEKHGYTKINFLTGPEDNPVSHQRLDAYKRILKEHNLPFEEERVYFGDFWKIAAYDAVEKWVSDPENLPEAIICANDYMAVTVCNALMEKGISVPKTIAVSGCDHIELSEDFSPSITTAGMPIFDMGVEAVNKIHKHNQGMKQEKNSYLKSITYFRQSCGCKVRGSLDEIIKRRNHIINEVEDKEKAISNNAYMSIDLTGVTLLDNLDKKLASYTYMNEGFSSFFMCLYKDWDRYQETGTEEHCGSDMVMEVGVKNGEWLQKVDFSIDDLLPRVYLDDRPQIFYFNMLHHQDKCFGYTAISFHTLKAYKPSYQGWLINICNALENIKIHSELNRLVYKLEDMYVKDEMTGLYNRRALHTLGQKYLQQSLEKQGGLLVLSVDMDNLKRINDNYGHGNGDIAIKTVADALMQAAEDDEICIRMGGDEFSVIGLEYDDAKVKNFIKKFEEAIQSFNEAASYGFRVRVSYGWSITHPNEYTRIEDCLSIADARMYQQKYEKEALRLKHMDGRLLDSE